MIIGIPDHWDCINFVYVCLADKDIYVEKPLANTITKCYIMALAAKQYNLLVQVCQQKRCNIAFKEPMELIKEGWIGNLRQVKSGPILTTALVLLRLKTAWCPNMWITIFG